MKILSELDMLIRVSVLSDQCPICNEELKHFFGLYSDISNGIKMQIPLAECKVCKETYISKYTENYIIDLQLDINLNIVDSLIVLCKNSVLPKKVLLRVPNEADNIDLTQENDITVYVYYGMMGCQKRKHQIECVTAKVRDMYDDEVIFDVNIQYCNTCKKYFIAYESLIGYYDNGKRPSMKLYLMNELDGESCYGREESLLNIYGYNTQINVKYRRKVLMEVIDNQYIEKHEILQHIRYLIKRNGKDPAKWKAKEKWQSDLHFIDNYKTSHQKKVSGVLDYRYPLE